MHTSGGRVSMVIDGVTYSARGVIKLNKANQSNESGVNQDGTLYRTVKPKARTAECTFDRFVRQSDGTSLIWDENVLAMTNMQVTFTETDGGQQHIMTGAFWVGDPGEDLSSGEIDGMSLAADNCKTINL